MATWCSPFLFYHIFKLLKSRNAISILIFIVIHGHIQGFWDTKTGAVTILGSWGTKGSIAVGFYRLNDPPAEPLFDVRFRDVPGRGQMMLIIKISELSVGLVIRLPSSLRILLKLCVAQSLLIGYVEVHIGKLGYFTSLLVNVMF